MFLQQVICSGRNYGKRDFKMQKASGYQSAEFRQLVDVMVRIQRIGPPSGQGTENLWTLQLGYKNLVNIKGRE